MHSIRRLAGLIYILKADSHCIARNLEEDMKISAFLRLLNKKTKKYWQEQPSHKIKIISRKLDLLSKLNYNTVK